MARLRRYENLKCSVCAGVKIVLKVNVLILVLIGCSFSYINCRVKRQWLVITKASSEAAVKAEFLTIRSCWIFNQNAMLVGRNCSIGHS